MAFATKWMIYAIMPLLTIGMIYLFELNHVIGRIFGSPTRIFWSDYFPFKLPLGLVFVGFMTMGTLAFTGVYSKSNAKKDLTARASMSYEEWLKKEEISNPTRTDVRVDMHRIRLDGWSPPKHFYVDFFDMTSGQEYERVYVSKHCSKTNELVRGDEYNIQVQVYTLSTQPGKEFREFKNLYGTFC